MHDETRTTRILMGVAVVAFLALLALAIGHDRNDSAAGGVEGVTWVLDSVAADGNEGGVLPGTELTAVFEDGSVNGSAGCNSYFGSYELDGVSITIGPLASTQMFCAEPPLAMDQEAAFMMLLEAMDQVVSVSGDELVLEGNGTESTFLAG